MILFLTIGYLFHLLCMVILLFFCQNVANKICGRQDILETENDILSKRLDNMVSYVKLLDKQSATATWTSTLVLATLNKDKETIEMARDKLKELKGPTQH